MLDFLLKKQRESIRKEYLFRFLNILLLFVSFTLVFGVVIKSSTFFFLQNQNIEISHRIDGLQSTVNSTKYDELQLVNENVMAHLKNFNANNLNYYALYNFIENSSPQGVVIATVSVNKVTPLNKEIKHSVKIEGNAESRNRLVSFVNNLKNENLFEDVTLPLSNLASDSDINFTLDLIIKNSNPKNYE